MRILAFVVALTVGMLWVGDASAQEKPRPNVVIILTDDMGYSDLGCYGSEIPTPNLDRLAGGGLRFTQFYNTARCCPTRASLLTGLYPHQAGIGHMTDDRGVDGYRGELNNRCVTIGQVMKTAGYGTYAVGKWHVVNSRNIKPDGDKANWPRQRGFDRFYGTIPGGGNFFDPGGLTRDNTMISAKADPEYKPREYYYTDAITDHATRFIADHHTASPDKPLFMYVAYTAAHWPMHAPPDLIAKHKGKYDGGYAPIREARLKKMKELGLVDDAWKVPPLVGDWAKENNKEWEARCMEVYAAMIEQMDAGVGKIVDAMQRAGRLDNTLILYMQDNGACQETVGRQAKPPAAQKHTPIADDAVTLAVIPKQTRDGRHVRQGVGVMPGGDDTYVAYGENWANVSNTPFRMYKHFVHEGGISTPLIAYWPKGIARKGEFERQPGHLIDIMATCVDVSGATYPAAGEKAAADKAIQPMEGRSLTPAFEGKPIDRQAIYWEHEGNRAVRVGDWKLVAKGREGPWELYDVAKDRTETNDLSKAEPQRAKDMAELWETYAKRAGVIPWPGPARNEASAKTSFTLKPGDTLPGPQSPAVNERGFTITAEVVKPGDGVIVAQGGSALGFALWVNGGKPTFTLRYNNQIVSAAAKDPLPAAACKLTATLSADGTLSLSVDGKPVASAKAPGTLPRQPVEGLQVGRDEGNLVGPYKGESKFDGNLGAVTIELTGK